MSTETKIFAQGSIPEYEHDGDNQDRYYLPAKSLSFLANPSRAASSNLFILPEDSQGLVRTYQRQLAELYGHLGFASQSLGRALFVPDSDYFLDRCIRDGLTEVMAELDCQTRYLVYPYANTELLSEWVEPIRSQGFNLEIAASPKIYFQDLDSPLHRGGWSRRVDNPSQPSFPERYNIPYPISYMGRNLEEVEKAYIAVTERTNQSEAFFKPVFSAGGFTLAKINNRSDLVSHYQQLEDSGALTILGQTSPIEIQEAITDIQTFYSLQYDSEQVVSPRVLTEQLIHELNWAGNVFNLDCSEAIRSQASQIFQRIARGVRQYSGQPLQGWGGVDFALTTRSNQPELMMIEHNGQRITGGHSSIALAESFGSQGLYKAEKVPGEANCDLAALWDGLREVNCQLDLSSKSGVFPLVWLPGSAMLWATAEDRDSLDCLMDQSFNNLLRRGYIKS